MYFSAGTDLHWDMGKEKAVDDDGLEERQLEIEKNKDTYFKLVVSILRIILNETFKF